MKALICITSCNRIDEVKKYILPYIDFVNNNEDFHFVLAHDGLSQDYIDFCAEFEIPLIYSDKREGVGLSKNRVLKQFPDFDYYFFIDDDVELFDDRIFSRHISISQKAQPNFHHLSSTSLFEVLDCNFVDNHKVLYNKRGGGYFNFFTKQGLETVGGWHTDFAKYKRYGHTEHSYRFVNSGLSKYPFNVIQQCINMLAVHNPEHVTKPIIERVDPSNELFDLEKKIIESKLDFFPLSTISKFNFNAYSTKTCEKVAIYLNENKHLYPFLNGKNRRRALSSHYFHGFLVNSKGFRIINLFKSFLLFPNNPAIKHWIKTKLLRK